jgi:predicted transposase YdaD
VGAPKELVDKYFLKPFTLVDLTQIDDEQIKQKAWAGVMEFTLKHIFARDLLPYIMDIVRLLHELDDADSKQFSETVLKYIVDCGQFNNRKAFVDMVNTELPRNIGGKIMTLAELWIEEGIEKGLEKGIEQGYQKGLTLAQQWKEEGIEKGIEKGIEQGMQQGAENAKWEFVQRLFKVHDDVAEVADLAGLPIEKVRAYQQNQLNSSHS